MTRQWVESRQYVTEKHVQNGKKLIDLLYLARGTRAPLSSVRHILFEGQLVKWVELQIPHDNEWDNLIKCKYNTFHYNFPSQLLRISFVLVFIFAAVSPGRVVWRYNIYKLRSVAILSYELWVLSIMIQSLTSII